MNREQIERKEVANAMKNICRYNIVSLFLQCGILLYFNRLMMEYGVYETEQFLRVCLFSVVISCGLSNYLYSKSIFRLLLGKKHKEGN